MAASLKDIDIESARDKVGSHVPGELLRVENLRTYFKVRAGTIRAVDGVSFAVEAGKTVCIVGESGSGKSVTALSVMRLIDPPGEIEPGSRILLDGRDLVGLSESELRGIRGDEIAMIFQEPMSSLNPVHTIGDQIAEAVREHTGASRHDARDRAIEMLRLVGIPEPERRARDYPHQLSGGQQQRVMIAVALSCDPKLLIADEPTTALDVTIQAQILELLRDLRDQLSMSILLITHDIGVVAEMADDVVVMYAGQVVEEGPLRDVLGSPQHPYTEALLTSIPLLGMSRSNPLRVIKGVVPSALRWPPGCRFASRCEHVFGQCWESTPPLFPVRDQQAACWLCERGARATAGIHEIAAQASR